MNRREAVKAALSGAAGACLGCSPRSDAPLVRSEAAPFGFRIVFGGLYAIAADNWDRPMDIGLAEVLLHNPKKSTSMQVPHTPRLRIPTAAVASDGCSGVRNNKHKYTEWSLANKQLAFVLPNGTAETVRAVSYFSQQEASSLCADGMEWQDVVWVPRMSSVVGRQRAALKNGIRTDLTWKESVLASRIHLKAGAIQAGPPSHAGYTLNGWKFTAETGYPEYAQLFTDRVEFASDGRFASVEIRLTDFKEKITDPTTSCSIVLKSVNGGDVVIDVQNSLDKGHEHEPPDHFVAYYDFLKDSVKARIPGDLYLCADTEKASVGNLRALEKDSRKVYVKDEERILRLPDQPDWPIYCPPALV